MLRLLYVRSEDPGPWGMLSISRQSSWPARRAVTLHSVALFYSRRSATAPAAHGSC